jgi:hypothetical protein
MGRMVGEDRREEPLIFVFRGVGSTRGLRGRGVDGICERASDLWVWDVRVVWEEGIGCFGSFHERLIRAICL